jgi:hypothetical protein
MAEFALMAGEAQVFGLLLDIGDRAEEVVGGPLNDKVLLALEQGEDFAVLLELITESGYELIDGVVHAKPGRFSAFIGAGEERFMGRGRPAWATLGRWEPGRPDAVARVLL